MKWVWTHDMRRHLYQRLAKQFGPHWTWKNRKPNVGELKTALTELADELSQMSGRLHRITPSAVRNQMKWATTSQISVMGIGHVGNFILNKAAALDVRFISSSELPRQLTISN